MKSYNHKTENMSKDFDINSNNCTLCKDKLVARWEMVPSSDCQLRSSVDEFIRISVDDVIEAQRSQPKESFKKWLNEKIKEVETSQNDLISKIQAGGINTHFKPANEAYWMNARALERYYEELENLETLDTAEDSAGTITKNRKPHYSINKDTAAKAYDYCKQRQCFDNAVNKTDWLYIFCGEYSEPKEKIKWKGEPQWLARLAKMLYNRTNTQWKPIKEFFLIQKERGTEWEAPTTKYLSTLASKTDVGFTGGLASAIGR